MGDVFPVLPRHLLLWTCAPSWKWRRVVGTCRLRPKALDRKLASSSLLLVPLGSEGGCLGYSPEGFWVGSRSPAAAPVTPVSSFPLIDRGGSKSSSLPPKLSQKQRKMIAMATKEPSTESISAKSPPAPTSTPTKTVRAW